MLTWLLRLELLAFWKPGRWPAVEAVSGTATCLQSALLPVAETLVVMLLIQLEECLVELCYTIGTAGVECALPFSVWPGWRALNCPVMLLLLLNPALGGLMMLFIAGVGWLDD
ncbi:hypothetical protein Nepgr_018711 [Nepenthes gracilis]|uniref:Uncharacterized protein n=1 Tax=Nepenthes gracilis TaxID=150966 RepID=A0AAD3STY8_NEPGR|nr:hypothetical protein Nepgr_018711 [Nepenthes gracilis]